MNKENSEISNIVNNQAYNTDGQNGGGEKRIGGAEAIKVSKNDLEI